MNLTLRTRIARQHLLALALPASLVLTLAPGVHAADGTWILNGSANWNTATTSPWSGGIVAEGADFTADFSTIDITTANRTVTLSAPLTIGNLKFGDTATGTAFGWALSGSTLTLQTTTGTPTITANALGGTSVTTISSALAGTQGFTKEGAGKLVLSGAHASLSGSIAVNAGTLDLWDTTAAYGNSISLTTATSTLDAANSGNGTTITVNGNVTGLGRINKTGSTSALVLNGDNTYSGGTTLTAGTIVMGGGLNNGIGTGTLTLGGGALRSSDNNTRTIANTLGAMGSNALRLGGLQGDTTGLGDLNFTGTGTVSIGGSKNWTVNNSTVATFANNWSGNSGWTITKLGTGTLVFNGNLTSGGVALTVGAGQFVLGGSANTYTGATIVNGGTLFVNGSKTGAGTVTVNSTGTLAGIGSIAGAVSAASGSFLAPGSSAGTAGTLTFTGTLDVSGLASGTGGLVFNLDGVGSSDKIVAGSVTIGNGALDLADFSFSTLGGFGAGVYTLLDATSIVGTLGSGVAGTLGGYDTLLSIDGISNNLILTVTAAAVPEPSAFAAFAGAMALASVGCARRRRPV